MRFNTGNPVEPNGSSDPRDLYDTAAIADLLVNGQLEWYLSRLGVPLKSWRGMMQQVIDYLIAQAYESVFLLYAAGVEVERQTQLVQRDGELYRVRNAADIPLTLTGTWGTDAPKLQAVGDYALRQALALPNGAKQLVGGSLFKGEALDPNGTAPGTSVTRGFGHAYYPEFAGALRVGGSDLVPLNDEKGYWVGLPNQNAWGSPLNIGLYSAAFNRNGASYGTYSTTFGHDCVAYGVASLAGGAGSATGNPANISLPFTGYCAIAYGKNVLASGEKSAGFGEEHVLNTRSATGLGYSVQSQPSGATPAPVGSFGAGQSINLTGQGYGVGTFLNVNDGHLYGSGVSVGSPMNSAGPNQAGIGMGTVLPAIIVEKPVTPGARSRIGINNLRALNNELDIDITPGQRMGITIDGTGSATLALMGIKNDGSELALVSFVWSHGNTGTALGELNVFMNGRVTAALRIAADGSIGMGELKTIATVTGSPGGTLYRDASNFVKIV